MRRSLASQGFPITEPRQIRTLSSPIRQDIMDAVTAIGPCSVADLATSLGKRPDGLYYHVKRLLAVGLLKESAHGENGRADLRLDVAHRAFFLDYQPANRTNKLAVLRVIGAMVRSAERTFRRAFKPGVVVKGPQRNLWAARTRGALSPKELAELNELLDRVNTLMQSGRRDAEVNGSGERTLYEFTFVLAPAGGGRGP